MGHFQIVLKLNCVHGSRSDRKGCGVHPNTNTIWVEGRARWEGGILNFDSKRNRYEIGEAPFLTPISHNKYPCQCDFVSIKKLDLRGQIELFLPGLYQFAHINCLSQITAHHVSSTPRKRRPRTRCGLFPGYTWQICSSEVRLHGNAEEEFEVPAGCCGCLFQALG